MNQLPAMLNLLIPVLGLVVLLAFSLHRVPEGEARLVNRFGRYHRTLKPGWRWQLPLLDRDGGRYPLLGHHVEVHLPQVQSDADIYFQVLEPAVSGPALGRLDDLVTLEATARLVDLGRERAEDDSLSSLSNRYCDSLNRHLGRLGLRVIRCQLHLPTL
ncbi:MAG: hypothetical protein KDI75_01510 [Xanthomonadales bacterium]|nr:hypothetical protein [Xanthomonadales bacterium]